jgi:putative ABC transport system permease protein
MSKGPFVFDIEHAIDNWKQFVSRTRSLEPGDLDELEDHLRAELDASRESGMPDEERFRVAVRRIGSLDGLERSYRQVVRDKRWTPSQWPARASAGLDLIRSYARAAWSSMIRHKGHALLNLTGLGLALAACILILVHVSSELGFDQYHEDADRIYRIEMLVPKDQHWGMTYLTVGPQLADNIPGVEHVARVTSPQSKIMRLGDAGFIEDRFMYGDPSLFDVFDFEVILGDVSGLERPQTLMLSASTASRFFGEMNPVGQTIEVSIRSSDPPVDYEVVGVFEDIRQDSHFVVDFIASQATRIATMDADVQWHNLAYTYVTLHPDVTLEEFQSRLDPFWIDLFEDRGYQAETRPVVQPLTRIHLHGQLTSSDIQPQGRFSYVLIFIGAAILLLLVACINYINLTVARYMARVREVGVRKVIGATRRQLIVQFYGEALGYTTGAFLIAGLFILASYPLLDSSFSVAWQWKESLQVLAWYLIPTIGLIALIAGSYPALFLSAFSPNAVLKGATPSGHRALLRKGLLVFQFMITSVLIVATVVVHRQLEFAQDTRFGFEQEQIVLLPTRGALPEGSDAMRTALASIPGVEAVSGASGFPGYPAALRWFDEVEEYEGEEVVLEMFWGDATYVSTLGLELADGRFFDQDRPGDRGSAVLLNEAAVRAFGWQDPIGKRLGTGDRQREVVGVVRDFHTTSMFEEIGPVIIELGSSSAWMGAKVSTQGLRQTMASVEATWNEFIPGRPFEYSFLDDDFKAMYQQEQRLARLFTGFSLLTIIVAILGLIGLVAFDGRQRRKEIGIRKSMGASTSDIVYLLSGRFFILVLVGFAASIPVSMTLTSWWLERFAYQTPVSLVLFVLAGGLIVTIALLTVGIQAARSARVAPVECLRQD